MTAASNRGADGYDEAYFSWQRQTAEGSAAALLPVVIELLAPRSILDVGCGTGVWLREAMRLGVEDVLGFDFGGAGSLVIPQERFRQIDLERPVEVPRRFDLAICMEVAEHLSPARGPALVRELAQAADAVVFSAAIPGQTPPGSPEHPNERWQSYWAGLFGDAGYEPVDALRPHIWDDRRIAFWYRQNAFVASGPEVAQRLSGERTIRDVVHPEMWSRVHPELWSRQISLKAHLRAMPRAAARAVIRRL